MSERHNQNGDSHEGDRFPEELLTAYALGQLADAERGEIERMLANPAQATAREQVAAIQRLAGELSPALAAADGSPESSPTLREAVIAHLIQPTVEVARRKRWLGLTWIEWTVAGGIACVLLGLWLPGVQMARDASRQVADAPEETRKEFRTARAAGSTSASTADHTTVQLPEFALSADPQATTLTAPGDSAPDANGEKWFDQQIKSQTVNLTAQVAEDVNAAPIQVELNKFGEETAPKNDLLASVGAYKGGGVSGREAANRGSLVQATGGSPVHSGFAPRVDLRNGQSQYQGQSFAQDRIITQNVQMGVTPRIIVQEEEDSGLALGEKGRESVRDRSLLTELHGSERYEAIHENLFLAPRQNPLSTFSIDVDTASYANMRRFLTGGSLPPADAVRIEELVNYFRYDYPQPKGPEPFSVNMEVAECPWAESHLLLRVGLKGKEVHRGERPQSNLVFLLDVSGSMADENKLPLLKTAMQMLVRELGENDRVSIVTYAGEAGLRLPPTRGHEQEKILAAIESLSSGGSTNGSAGIDLAYEQAKAYFVEGGTNRVILCTDGDLNVGITDDEALVQLIKQKAGGGTFLTVLGFGEGNLQDAKMEKLADNGNGLYAYIDSVREARKVLVEQMTGSTITIAKDVKIQVEFNPAVIASYRLLGYENRVLAAQDFNNDKKDAGEIGAGHTVTALYELVPVGAKPEAAAPVGVEPLKYQESGVRGQESADKGQEPGKLTDAAKSGELLTLKLRYKEPEGQASKLLEVPLKDRGGKFNGASKDLQFAAAVASFGMILRGSEHKGGSNIAAVEEIASGAIGEDAGGYRAEFVDLVRKAHSLGAK